MYAGILPHWELQLPIDVSRMHNCRAFTICFRELGCPRSICAATLLGQRECWRSSHDRHPCLNGRALGSYAPWKR